jgi:hypothetical protein
VQAEIEAAQNVVRLLNERYQGQLRFDVHPEVLNDMRSLIPGSLPLAVENMVRNTIISSGEPFTITCYSEDDGYLVLQSRLNDRLIPHENSTHSLMRLQKSYTLYSDKPMIQVKAYAENYLKFPVVMVSEGVHLL